tara:strand:- start:1166 stop:1462 length:297 start_codon:yes stop_codon:yes gene_type:complete
MRLNNVVLPLPVAPKTKSTESGLPTSPFAFASCLFNCKISVHAFSEPGANGVVGGAAADEPAVRDDAGREDIAKGSHGSVTVISSHRARLANDQEPNR